MNHYPDRSVNPFPHLGASFPPGHHEGRCQALQLMQELHDASPPSPKPPTASRVFGVTSTLTWCDAAQSMFHETTGTWPYPLPFQNPYPFEVRGVDEPTQRRLIDESAVMTPEEWLNRIVSLGGHVIIDSGHLACAVKVSGVFPFTHNGRKFTLPSSCTGIKYEAVREGDAVVAKLSIEGTGVTARAATVELAIPHLRHAWMLHLSDTPPQN
jgi:hypothetical protein